MLNATYVGRLGFDATHDPERKCYRISVSEKAGDKTYTNIELTKFYTTEVPEVLKFLTKGQTVAVVFRPTPQAWIDKATGELRTKLGGVISQLEVQFPLRAEEASHK